MLQQLSRRFSLSASVLALLTLAQSNAFSQCTEPDYVQAWVDPFGGYDGGVSQVDQPTQPFATINAAINAVRSELQNPGNENARGLVHALAS